MPRLRRRGMVTGGIVIAFSVVSPAARAAPIINGLGAGMITATGAVVTWTTDVPATSQLQYGNSSDMMTTFLTDGSHLTQAHSFSLAALGPGTLYYFRAYSADATGQMAQASGSFLTSPFDPAGPYDFAVTLRGPVHAVRGYTLYLMLDTWLLAGSRQEVRLKVDGLPPGASVYFPAQNGAYYERNDQPGYPYWAYSTQSTALGIKIGADTPLGPSTIHVTLLSGGVLHEARWAIQVDDVPPPLPRSAISSVPPIADLAKWEDQMVTYGKKNCNLVDITRRGLWEGNIWYYDGERVYYQIEDYTHDPSWALCAGYSAGIYRPYVLDNHGGVPGYRVFPQGLYMDYVRTGDQLSRDAVGMLATAAAFSYTGGGPDDSLAREDAYRIQSLLYAEKLGFPHDERLNRAVDFGLGILDMFFISNNVQYKQPFMAGLLMASLIEWYEATGDPRIPPVVKATADWLWANAWMPSGKAFWYQSSDLPPTPTPDLNLLIAPAYAWLWAMTGDPLYLDQGDQIFSGGVDGAWLDQGKQFSQNFRWSFDYVRWRSNPDAFFPRPPPDPSPLPLPSVRLPAFTLSSLNGRTFSLTEELEFSYPVSGVTFEWAFTPASPLSSAMMGPGFQSSQRTSKAALTTTSAPRFSPSRAGLTPGTYRLTVTVSQADSSSQSASATITLTGSTLSGVKVYPNPWRSDKHAAHPHIFFDGLAVGATIKLFTVSGYEVKELHADGPTIGWDLTNDSGDRVASGIYLYLITDRQGDQARGQLAVVR